MTPAEKQANEFEQILHLLRQCRNAEAIPKLERYNRTYAHPPQPAKKKPKRASRRSRAETAATAKLAP